MSWTRSFTTTWGKTDRRSRRFFKRILLVGALFGVAGAAYGVVSTPTLREKLPTPIQSEVLATEALYQRLVDGDVIVHSKQIKAKKLLKKSDRTVHYRGGMVSHKHMKRFKLSSDLDATIQVETLASPRYAARLVASRGGSGEDTLYVNHPSFLESHGLDDDRRYFLTAVARSDEHVVTVTLTRKLGKAELERALGPNYETIMGQYADQLLGKVTELTKIQLERLARLDY